MKDNLNYTQIAQSMADIYKLDVELLPSVKLEKICNIITDKSLDDMTRIELIKKELYIK